jgi:H+/Cl- antiporter ClcA
MIGVVATLLAVASEYASSLVLHVARTWPLAPLALTPAGLIVIAWLTRRFFPAAEGSGIPQAMAMLEVSDEARRKEILGLGTGIFKGLMIVVGIACGASIGREGPTVHIATAISYSLSRIGRFGRYLPRRRLILAGAAAGLSAAFNTPLAGVVFAIEEMSRSFEARTSGIVLIAVIVAGMTALSLQGSYSYFGTVNVPVEPIDTIGAVVLCGTVGGLFGGLFSTLLIQGGSSLGGLRRSHPYAFAAGCGLLLAGIGLLSEGATYGTGYEQAKLALSHGEGGGPYTPVLKLLATLVSYLSGIPGGIFAPSLSAGATLGVEIAPFLGSVPVAVVALLTMAGYFSGVVQAPMTSMVIIMEMTDDQHLLLPLMATVLLAQWVSRHVCPRPIYLALADSFLKGEGKQRNRRVERS